MADATIIPPSENSPEAPTAGRFYRPELDALRFVAFLAVFLRHTTPDQAHWYQSKLHLPARISDFLATLSLTGTFGVYLFFGLSAYLITTLLLREKQELGRLHVREFYIRRMLRIWPLYFFIIAVGSVFGHFFPPIDWGSLPFFFVMLGNWAVIFRGEISKVLNPLWSLSVEEQFYLLWPPVISKASIQTMRMIAIALLLLPIPAILLGRNTLYFAYMNSFSAFSALGVGILLASQKEKHGDPAISRRYMLWGLGIAAWYIASAAHIGDSAGRSLTALLFVNLGVVAFLVGSFGWQPRPQIVRLGKISYGLYMYHELVITSFEIALGRKTANPKLYPLMIVAELVVTIGLASISYRFLESPFLRLKEKFTLIHSRPV